MTMLLVLSTILAATPATSPTPDDASAYCEYVTSSADSNAARLVAPDLVGSFGWVHESEELFGVGEVDQLHPRVTVGLRYSVSDLRRGLLLRAEGRAECERYRTISALRTFLEIGSKGVVRRALERRLDVLRSALPNGEAILAAADAQLRSGSMTAAERDATAVRLDGLRGVAASTARELAALPQGATAGGTAPSVTALLERRAGDEERVARAEASLREVRAWDLQLRGGYDEVFGGRDRIPVFAVASVTFNLGALWQGSRDARAVAARRSWSQTEVEGVGDRATLALKELRAELDAERPRLAQVRALSDDLRARYEATAALQGDKVKHFRDYLWFDLVRTEADRAYLQEHVAALASLLGDVGE